MSDYLESLRDVGAADSEGRGTERARSARRGSAGRHSGRFRRARAAALRPAAAGLSADLTRVITFMYGREQTGRPYPQIGIPEPHHPLTHHQNDPAKMEKCTAIQLYHVALFAGYLEKLRATPDGDGSLLDHVVLLYGGGISNSDRHTHGPLPTLCSGGGAGTIKGGRHLVYPEDTPLTNLQGAEKKRPATLS